MRIVSALKIHVTAGAEVRTWAAQQLQLQNGAQRSSPFSWDWLPDLFTISLVCAMVSLSSVSAQGKHDRTTK